MTKVADLHEAWSEDAEYRTEYERLGLEFALARDHRRAYPRALDAGRAGGTDGDHPIGCRPAGERTRPAVDPYVGKGGAGDGHPPSDSLRSGMTAVSVGPSRSPLQAPFAFPPLSPAPLHSQPFAR